MVVYKVTQSPQMLVSVSEIETPFQNSIVTNQVLQLPLHSPWHRTHGREICSFTIQSMLLLFPWFLSIPNLLCSHFKTKRIVIFKLKHCCKSAIHFQLFTNKRIKKKNQYSFVTKTTWYNLLTIHTFKDLAFQRTSNSGRKITLWTK